MRRVRLTLRNAVVLVVLLTLAVLLLNLPLTARYPRLLLHGSNHPPAAGTSLLSVQAINGPGNVDPSHQADPLAQPLTNTIVGNKTIDKGYIANTSLGDEGAAKEPVGEEAIPWDANSKQSSDGAAITVTTPKDDAIKNISSPKSPNVSAPPEKSAEDQKFPKTEKETMSPNDYGTYLQDHTPTGFVEVKKVKPIAKKKNSMQRMRPARLNRRHNYNVSSSSVSKLTPQVLKARALTFSNSSDLRKFLTEQERRAQHVAETCKVAQHPETAVRGRAFAPPASLMSSKDIIYDKANHLLFCPVYKAASTSWSITLLNMGGFWNKAIKQDGLQNVLHEVYPRINNMAAASMGATTTRFMVVRHPFERVLSCYRDKYKDGNKAYYYLHYGEKMVRRYRKFSPSLSLKQKKLLEDQVRDKIKRNVPAVLRDNPYANPVGPTFPEFVHYIVDARYDDEHWRTYNAHCSPCLIPYNFILRFESLKDEGRLFLEYLNRSSDFQLRWDNPTSGSTSGEVACSYFNELPLELMQKLYVKYEKDFKLYEYMPDAYFKCAKDYRDTNDPSEKISEKEKSVKAFSKKNAV